jgi:sugar/nucleoside kinase (ribokinase family)
MTSAEMPPIKRSDAVPRILCAGVIVFDEVFRVEEFPLPDGKVQTNGFFVVNGGCAANAAVAIARLGGRALLAGPMGGPKGKDANGDRVLHALKREHVDCAFCQRVPGLATALSAIFLNTRGDRTIVTYCGKRIAATMPTDADAAVAVAGVLLADNCFPDFVLPICTAARRRRLPVVLNGDRRTVENDPLFRLATHVIFSSECLRQTTGTANLAEGLKRIACNTEAFIAVSNGPEDILYLEGDAVQHLALPWTRLAPATPSTAALRWRWAKAKAKSRPCASAPRWPGSNALGSVARRACRGDPRSRHSSPSIDGWPTDPRHPANR